jgi:hypothetical protein
VAAVKDHITLPDRLLLFEKIHLLAAGKPPGTGLDMAAEVTVAHLFPTAHPGAVGSEKSDPRINESSKIIKKRLHLITEDQFKS